MIVGVNEQIDLLTFASGSFATIGGYFLVRSIIANSARQLASLTGTYLGSNPHLQRSFVEQKADTLIGFAFIFVSGVASACCALFKLSINATAWSYSILILIDALLLFLSWFFAKKYRQGLGERTALIDFMFRVESCIKYPNQFDAAKLKEEAKRKGLEKFFGDAVDPYECLKRCAVAAGASGGAELIEEIRRKKLQPMI